MMTDIDEPEIIRAAHDGDVARIARLLANEPDVVHVRGADGRTALHHAAEQGHVEVINLLVALDADLDAWEQHTGEKPLHLAVRRRHRAVVRALLAAGADPNVRDLDWGYAPLHTAVLSGATRELADFFALRDTIATAHELITMLLAWGADPNPRDAFRDETPLHTAARLGKSEAVFALLAGGADRAARNVRGRRPLDLAADAGFEDLLTVLAPNAR
jgi:ankyrin repeat protein